MIQDDKGRSGIVPERMPPPASQDEEGRVGIFPSWSWVYRAVVIYGVLMIVALTLLTRILNFGAGS